MPWPCTKLVENHDKHDLTSPFFLPCAAAAASTDDRIRKEERERKRTGPAGDHVGGHRSGVFVRRRFPWEDSRRDNTDTQVPSPPPGVAAKKVHSANKILFEFRKLEINPFRSPTFSFEKKFNISDLSVSHGLSCLSSCSYDHSIWPFPLARGNYVVKE